MTTLYLILNEELELSPVEVAVRSSMAVASMVKLLEGMKPGYLKFYTEWVVDGMQIKILKTDWDSFDSLWEAFGKNIPEFKKSPWCIGELDEEDETGVSDLTPDGTLKVLAFRPMKKEGVPKELRSLKPYMV